MRERDPARSIPGAKLFSGETPTAAELRDFRRKHCAQCGRPFGLTRRQRAGKQFCSAQCVAEFTGEARDPVQARSHWYDFLYQRR
jgi:hypothetical protein